MLSLELPAEFGYVFHHSFGIFRRRPFHLARMPAPIIGKGHCPARMNGGKHFLTYFTSEESSKHPEGRFQASYTVTVRHQELMTVQILDRITVNNLDAEFRRQVIINPDVMVADKPDYPYATVGKFRELTEETHETARYDVSVFIPVIKYITQQKDCVGFLLDGIEKVDNTFFSLTRIMEIRGPQMEVTKKICYHQSSKFITEDA